MNNHKMVTVITHNEVLIGFITEAPPQFANLLFSGGIWLQRKTHLSFISNDDILQIRPMTIFDKEIDNRQ